MAMLTVVKVGGGLGREAAQQRSSAHAAPIAGWPC
jgi:hypothetical protein